MRRTTVLVWGALNAARRSTSSTEGLKPLSAACNSEEEVDLLPMLPNTTRRATTASDLNTGLVQAETLHRSLRK